MYYWNVKKISNNEYHVVETRFVNEPEYVLAKCSGPVPADDIVRAMRVSQSIRSGRDGINCSVSGIETALRMFKSEVAAAEKGESQPHIAQQAHHKTDAS